MWRAARSMWAEPAVATPPARMRRDEVLAGVVLVAAGIETLTRVAPGWRPAAVVLGCVLAVAVLIRRTRPLTAVGLAFGTFVVLDLGALALGVDQLFLYTGTIVLVLLHSLYRWGSGREAVLGGALAAVALTVSVGVESTDAGDAVGGVAVLLFAAALGTAMRYRAMAREQLVEQARLHEREELARELHDTVAHHLSAIAIQAQAGLVLARSSSPGGAAEALETIDREAARTLAEMRGMVGALRAPLSPRPRLADIETLAAAGTDTLRVDVELRGDLTGLPPAVEAALYRVAQESVTNARRHAHLATRVEVTVTGSASDVQLTVRDDGARTMPAAPSGYGLVGMTERVALVGGTLEAGPKAGRGWCVHAVLPRSRSAT